MKRLLYTLILLIMLFGFFFCGCENNNKPLAKTALFLTDPNLCNPNKLMMSYYPYLDLVIVEPNSPEYHAEQLIHTYRYDDAAYHIIAIGILKQNTPEVREALSAAIKRFGAEPIPDGYDWPDLAENFKSSFNLDNPILDYYPGHRGLTFIDFIIECSYYLGCQSWVMSEIQTITDENFDLNTHFDTLQFLQQM